MQAELQNNLYRIGRNIIVHIGKQIFDLKKSSCIVLGFVEDLMP